MIVTDFWKAFQAGKEIKDPAKWKNIQNLTNAVAAVLSFALAVAKVFGYDLSVTDEQIIVFAGGLAAILATVNSVLTVITTKKISITGETNEPR